MSRPVSPKLGAWLAAAAVGLLTTTTSIEPARAGDGGLSLADLAGSYAGRQGGFLSICFTSDYSNFAPCTNPSSVAVQFNDTEVLQGTFSPQGQHLQFCLTDTDVFSQVGGSTAPARIIDFIAEGSSTSYDPKTRTGKTKFTLYVHTHNPDNGVRCNGANLVNPQGVKKDSDGTQDFTVSEEPALHLDAVITSLTAADGTYGGFVLGSTLYIQEK